MDTRHDIAEILLMIVLNTNQPIHQSANGKKIQNVGYSQFVNQHIFCVDLLKHKARYEYIKLTTYATTIMSLYLTTFNVPSTQSRFCPS
jgi:hypothetical protein